MSVKAARQRALADLLRTRQVSSQAVVLEHLRGQGFHATQATISRDLEDLGAGKVRGPDGRLVYALPEPGNGHGADHDEVRRMLGGSLLAIVPSGNLVVLDPARPRGRARLHPRPGRHRRGRGHGRRRRHRPGRLHRAHPGRVLARQLAALAVTPPALAEPYRGATA